MNGQHGERGFTLIELVVTMTLIAISATAIVTIFITIGNLDQQARHMSIATQQLQIKMEAYRNQSYSAIPIGSPAEDFSASLPSDLPSPRTATVSVTENPSGLKYVDIQISYTEGKITKRVQVATYMALHGTGR